ncbi:hypothetical protein BDA99DRAFT_544404 [Phascolomyces articulosus]|uniref:Uncharacterized protein n=1 Tax=Phascolomyces articulosus TaxID=60185 RepID=A0AAD5JLH5_9FUNG|nr:hypothetical protein BDA99DRAFT_544404 [Phascolomyces articulosus]
MNNTVVSSPTTILVIYKMSGYYELLLSPNALHMSMNEVESFIMEYHESRYVGCFVLFKDDWIRVMSIDGFAHHYHDTIEEGCADTENNTYYETASTAISIREYTTKNSYRRDHLRGQLKIIYFNNSNKYMMLKIPSYKVVLCEVLTYCAFIYKIVLSTGRGITPRRPPYIHGETVLRHSSNRAKCGINNSYAVPQLYVVLTNSICDDPFYTANITDDEYLQLSSENHSIVASFSLSFLTLTF